MNLWSLTFEKVEEITKLRDIKIQDWRAGKLAVAPSARSRKQSQAVGAGRAAVGGQTGRSIAEVVQGGGGLRVPLPWAGFQDGQARAYPSPSNK